MMTLGIDLGGTDVKLGVIENGNIIYQTTCPTPLTEGYEAVLNCLLNQADRLLSAYPEVDFAGLGSPGLVDMDSGTVLYSNNFGWNNMPLGRDMSCGLGMDVRIANDARCAALGEALFGAGQGCARMAMLTLGTGVGGGFVKDGRLEGDLYGSMAYLFGHMVIEQDGRQCSCGRRGCLEAYASGGAAAKAAVQAGLDTRDVRAVFMAAGEGERTALSIVERFLESLCVGVINIANILRPHKIVIGGGISGSGNLILPRLNQALKKGVYGYAYAPVEAVQAHLGNIAGLVGAGSLYTQ